MYCAIYTEKTYTISENDRRLLHRGFAEISKQRHNKITIVFPGLRTLTVTGVVTVAVLQPLLYCATVKIQIGKME